MALEPLNLNNIESFDDLLTAMGHTAFGGRNLARPPRCWRQW